MSDIKKGDLVIVVRPATCGCGRTIGHIRHVLAVKISRGAGRCVGCQRRSFPVGTWVAELKPGVWWEFTRLKRIDPPAETTEREQEMAL